VSGGVVCETEHFSVDESWLSRQPVASEPTSRLELSRKFAVQEKELIEAALRESTDRSMTFCNSRMFPGQE
jgi:hypothetical protein